MIVKYVALKLTSRKLEREWGSSNAEDFTPSLERKLKNLIKRLATMLEAHITQHK